jgi:hypothetical protein
VDTGDANEGLQASDAKTLGQVGGADRRGTADPGDTVHEHAPPLVTPQRVLGLAGIAVVIAAALAGIGQSKDSVGHGGADPWYLAAAWVAGAVVVALLMLFVIWPLFQTLPRLRTRILGQGRSHAAVPPETPPAGGPLTIDRARNGADGHGVWMNVAETVRAHVADDPIEDRCG